MRQWIVVTDWNPLTAFAHEQPYFRLTTSPWDLGESVQQLSAHATNRSLHESAPPCLADVPNLEPPNVWLREDFEKWSALASHPHLILQNATTFP